MDKIGDEVDGSSNDDDAEDVGEDGVCQNRAASLPITQRRVGDLVGMPTVNAT
jgi:hypothetical protein